MSDALAFGADESGGSEDCGGLRFVGPLDAAPEPVEDAAEDRVGAQLATDWKRRVKTFFGTPLQNGYGLTETTAGVSATRHGDDRPDDSVGAPLAGVTVRLAPPPDRDNLDDGVGETVVWGANVMKGYYKNPEATAAAFGPDGGLRTGDLGRFGPDGELYIVGRCKEPIVGSGFNVYPPEVEAGLNAHPGAALSEAGLKQSLSGVPTSYKWPSRIVIADRLPTAATGKILKHKPVEIFATELAAD